MCNNTLLISGLQEMERLQAKGEVPEAELKALELDMTGKVCFYSITQFIINRSLYFLRKIMLASWRGTRLEVITVLREVCDIVLKEKEIPENVLILRAKVYPV